MTLPHFPHLVDFSLPIPYYQARKVSAHTNIPGLSATNTFQRRTWFPHIDCLPETLHAV